MPILITGELTNMFTPQENPSWFIPSTKIRPSFTEAYTLGHSQPDWQEKLVQLLDPEIYKIYYSSAKTAPVFRYQFFADVEQGLSHRYNFKVYVEKNLLTIYGVLSGTIEPKLSPEQRTHIQHQLLKTTSSDPKDFLEKTDDIIRYLRIMNNLPKNLNEILADVRSELIEGAERNVYESVSIKEEKNRQWLKKNPDGLYRITKTIADSLKYNSSLERHESFATTTELTSFAGNVLKQKFAKDYTLFGNLRALQTHIKTALQVFGYHGQVREGYSEETIKKITDYLNALLGEKHDNYMQLEQDKAVDIDTSILCKILWKKIQTEYFSASVASSSAKPMSYYFDLFIGCILPNWEMSSSNAPTPEGWCEWMSWKPRSGREVPYKKEDRIAIGKLFFSSPSDFAHCLRAFYDRDFFPLSVFNHLFYGFFFHWLEEHELYKNNIEKLCREIFEIVFELARIAPATKSFMDLSFFAAKMYLRKKHQKQLNLSGSFLWNMVKGSDQYLAESINELGPVCDWFHTTYLTSEQRGEVLYNLINNGKSNLLVWTMQQEKTFFSKKDMGFRDQDGNTALHLAVIRGDLKAMKLLLLLGADLTLKNKDGMDFFQLVRKSPERSTIKAICKIFSDEHILRELVLPKRELSATEIQNIIDARLNRSSYYFSVAAFHKDNLLLAAVRYGRVKSIQRLIAIGFPLRMRNNEDLDATRLAIRMERQDLMEILLSAIDEENNPYSYKKMFIQFAIQEQKLNSLKFLCGKYKDRIFANDSIEFLIEAVKTGNLELIQWLAENINGQSPSLDGSALSAAVQTGNPRIVEILLNAGNNDYHLPLEGEKNYQTPALVTAAKENRLEILVILLGRAKYLSEDLLDKTKYSFSPEIYATLETAINKRRKIFAVLRDPKDTSEIDFSDQPLGCVDDQGKTFLMLAAAKGHVKMVRQLLTRREDGQVKCREYHNAFFYALIAEQLDIVKLFGETYHGVDFYQRDFPLEYALKDKDLNVLGKDKVLTDMVTELLLQAVRPGSKVLPDSRFGSEILQLIANDNALEFLLTFCKEHSCPDRIFGSLIRESLNEDDIKLLMRIGLKNPVVANAIFKDKLNVKLQRYNDLTIHEALSVLNEGDLHGTKVLVLLGESPLAARYDGTVTCDSLDFYNPRSFASQFIPDLSFFFARPTKEEEKLEQGATFSPKRARMLEAPAAPMISDSSSSSSASSSALLELDPSSTYSSEDIVALDQSDRFQSSSSIASFSRSMLMGFRRDADTTGPKRKREESDQASVAASSARSVLR